MEERNEKDSQSSKEKDAAQGCTGCAGAMLFFIGCSGVVSFESWGWFLAILGAFIMISLIVNNKREQRQAEEEAAALAAEEDRIARDKQAGVYGTFKHAAGLPLPEGALAKVYSCPNKIEINANGTQFNIDKDRITDISIKTNVEIQKHMVSSAGGAVGGAMLFGALGALVGGQAREETTSQTYEFLVFTYTKDDSINYIAFDVTDNLAQAKFFITSFKQHPQQTKIIDL